MSFERNNPQPAGPHAPRPSGSQITGARIQLYAQNHPAGFALRGGIATGAVTALLALVTAAPALNDPTGAPGWILVSVPAAMLFAAFTVGLLMYLHGRKLPRVEETDPARYASAELQAATGDLGPDPDTNRLARRMSDRLVYTSNPNHYMSGLFAVMAFISLRPLTEIIGPDFEPLMLLQLTPSVILLTVSIAMYRSAKNRHERFKAFREAYDASAS
ncbi:hypothetical protein ACWFMI_00055 [Nocardiopsis terrae]